MNEKKSGTNVRVLEKLSEAFDKNEISLELKRFLESSMEGKLFHHSQTLYRFKGFMSPFFNVTILNQPVPVSQYQEFTSKIQTAYPKLFRKEKEYSQNNIFDKTEHPMEYIKYIIPEYNDNLTFLRSTLRSKELFETTFNFTKFDDSEENGEKILDFYSKFSDSLHKKDRMAALNNLKKFNIQYQPSLKRKEDLNKGIDNLIPVLKEQKIRKAFIMENFSEFGRNLLRATNYTQSHIEYFCAYFHRLIHIKNNGDRNYRKNYYNYDSKSFWGKNFREACREELKDFKDLKTFLVKYSYILKVLRNINSHQVPGEICLSKDRKYILLQETGKKRKKRENYNLNKIRQN